MQKPKAIRLAILSGFVGTVTLVGKLLTKDEARRSLAMITIAGKTNGRTLGPAAWRHQIAI
jgi:hypothetical protein